MRDKVKGLFSILFCSSVHISFHSQKIDLSQKKQLLVAMDVTRVLILKHISDAEAP
jgi:hypothetical protein